MDFDDAKKVGCWNEQSGVPHRNYECVDFYALDPVLGDGLKTYDHNGQIMSWEGREKCEMCLCRWARYVHVMEHPDGTRKKAGKECARHMEQDPKAAEAREKPFRARDRLMRGLIKKWDKEHQRGPKGVRNSIQHMGVCFEVRESSNGWVPCLHSKGKTYKHAAQQTRFQAQVAAFNLYDHIQAVETWEDQLQLEWRAEREDHEDRLMEEWIAERGIDASPSRLGSGQWGVVVNTFIEPKPGDRLRVITKQGKMWSTTVDRVLSAKPWGWTCTTR